MNILIREDGYNMGQKYLMRTNEVREFPLQTINHTDYYTNSSLEFLRLLITKRKRIIYVTRWFD